MESVQFAFGAGAWWMYALLGLAALGGAVLTYRRTDPDPGAMARALLVSLRTLGLALLLLALFEPLLRIVQSSTTKPRVAVIVDDSRSVGYTDRTGDRKQAMKQVVDAVMKHVGNRADVILATDAARMVNEGWNADSLTFRGLRTDLGSAVRLATNRAEDRTYGAAILISDGQSNTGESPVYPAERSGMGMYTVGIGDSLPASDVRIVSVVAPPVAYVGKAITVNVECESAGLPEGETSVVLYDNGVEIGRQNYAIRKGIARQALSFTYTPSADGIRKLLVKSTPVSGEFSTANNTSATFLKVLKDARGVVVFAGAPSPDLAFVKGALETDPSINLRTFVQKQGSEFYEGAPSASLLNDAQACILVGFPVQSTPDAVMKMISDAAASGTSIMFIASQNTDYRKLMLLRNVLPFTVTSTRPQEFLVTPDVSRSAAADPLLSISGTDADAGVWNDMPPIFKTETFIKLTPGATVLASMRVNDVPMQEPLVIKNEVDNARCLAVMGYGLYRWKLLRDGPEQARGGQQNVAAADVLGTFLGNAVRWLSVRDDQDRIRIRPTQALYAAGENVVMTASVLDQRYAGIDGAEVRVKVSGGGSVRDVVLAPDGVGLYRLAMGVLPPGDYSYTGTVLHRGEQLGTRSGRFSVGDLSLEDAVITMNAPLMHTLADRTGGVFATPANVQRMLEALDADPRLAPVARSRESESALWYSPWLLGIALAAFALEWVVRKRRGLV